MQYKLEDTMDEVLKEIKKKGSIGGKKIG